MVDRRPLVALNGGAAEIPGGDTVPVASGGTGAATASAALGNLGLSSTGAVSFRNRIINGNFATNQRGAVAAATTTAANAYAYDRWKAGVVGSTASFAAQANGDRTITLSAGTLLQIILGTTYLAEGGTYVLSWTGTATARVYQGTATGLYTASPVLVSGLTAGTNATVEFSPGTIAAVQFEPGTVVTPFERRDDEQRRGQRFYRLLMANGDILAGFKAISATSAIGAINTSDNPMRVAPALLLSSPADFAGITDAGGTNTISAITLVSSTPRSSRLSITADAGWAAGSSVLLVANAASARLSLEADL